MCAVAVLLFISGVSACASAHGVPLSSVVVGKAYRRLDGKVVSGLRVRGWRSGLGSLLHLTLWAEVRRACSEGNSLDGCATTLAGLIFLSVGGK